MISIGDPGLAGVELSAPDTSRSSWSATTCRSRSGTVGRCSPRRHRRPRRVERDGVPRGDDRKRRAGGRRRRSGREGPRLAGYAAWADFVATQVEDGVPRSSSSRASTGRRQPHWTSSRPPARTSSGTPAGTAQRRSDRDRRRARPAGDPARAGPRLVQRQPVQRPVDQRGLRQAVRGAGDGGRRRGAAATRSDRGG